jgi:ferritin-like metal-binding protein YciE
MAKSGNELLITWLNDAYAMETTLVKVLEHRAKAAKDFPEVQAMDEQHLEETKQHAEMVKGCIERLGGSPSSVKSALGKMLALADVPMSAMAEDELVKNCLKDYAAEHFEVASYRALIEAASLLGDQETVRVCEQILQEDQAMADRIMASLPMVVASQTRELVGSST